jgi:hypothetical protein
MDLKRLNLRDRRVIAAVATGVIALVAVVALVVIDGDDDRDASPDGENSSQLVETTVGVPATGSARASTTTPAGSASSVALAPSTTGSPALTTPPSTATTVSGTGATTLPPTATTGTTAPPTSMVEVPVGTVEVLEPIPSNETGDFGTGLLVEVTAIEAVEATASQPGEIAGPAVAVELRAINDSDTAIDMLRMQVDVTYGPDRIPGNSLTDGSAPFEGILEPGATAIGRYVFGIPVDQRDVLQISVFYDVDAPIVVFEGPGPRA